MTKELKPCPFCGGEDGKHSEDCYIIMSQENVSFVNLHHKPMYACEELGEAYNTRYKRTCNMVAPNSETMPYPRCSACGVPMLNTPNRYCAQCGAEVVDVPHD